VISELKKKDYKGYVLQFEYTSDALYVITPLLEQDHCGFRLQRQALSERIHRSFEAKLFQPHWEDAAAYGIFKQAKLIAVVEVNNEKWSNRLRITNLLVAKDFRRQGLGKALIKYVKDKALEIGSRAIILETQSCNIKAIDFYRSQDFALIGLDTICYSNKDIEKNEVRLEFGFLIS